MRRPRDGGAEIAAGPDECLDSLAAEARSLHGRPRRTDEPPAAAETSGQGGGGVAVAEGKKRSGHGPTIPADAPIRKTA